MESRISIRIEKPNRVYITDTINHSGIVIDLEDISFEDQNLLYEQLGHLITVERDLAQDE